MRQVGTNLPKVGRYNRAVVLEQIQSSDGISRSEIAERTGLTPQTVSGIVRKLLDEGIVREDGASRVNVAGKSRITLRINADSGYAIGLQFDPVELACVVVDLVGQPVAIQRVPTSPGAPPDEVVTAMAALVADVLREADVPKNKVLGLGLASPGPLDQELGMVVAPPKLAHWTRIPVKQMLSRATGLPVTMDNDATAAVIGERWSGAGRSVASFAYFFCGTGVGGGLVLNHQVWRGGSFNAGEFGHTSLVPDGEDCYCGNRGCLETLISPAALVARLHARLAAPGVQSSLSEAFRRDPATVDDVALRAAAAAGDPVASEIIAEAADRLAAVAVNVVNITDVDLVVLGGYAVRDVEQLYLDAATKAITTRAMSRHIREVEVAISPLGADAAVIGAAALVLHATYSAQLSALLPE